MTENTNLMPVGTVVMLADSTAPVMICGYLPEGENHAGKIWDYSGFAFPIGQRDAREVYLFDDDQIEEILAMGYQDTESFAFLKKLHDVKKQLLEAEKDGGER